MEKNEQRMENFKSSTLISISGSPYVVHVPEARHHDEIRPLYPWEGWQYAGSVCCMHMGTGGPCRL